MKRLHLYAIWIIGLVISILLSYAWHGSEAMPFLIWVVVILISNSVAAAKDVTDKVKKSNEAK